MTGELRMPKNFIPTVGASVCDTHNGISAPEGWKVTDLSSFYSVDGVKFLTETVRENGDPEFLYLNKTLVILDFESSIYGEAVYPVGYSYDARVVGFGYLRRKK